MLNSHSLSFIVVITRVHVFTWPVALMKREVKSITDLEITFINNVFNDDEDLKRAFIQRAQSALQHFTYRID